MTTVAFSTAWPMPGAWTPREAEPATPLGKQTLQFTEDHVQQGNLDAVMMLDRHASAQVRVVAPTPKKRTRTELGNYRDASVPKSPLEAPFPTPKSLEAVQDLRMCMVESGLPTEMHLGLAAIERAVYYDIQELHKAWNVVWGKQHARESALSNKLQYTEKLCSALEERLNAQHGSCSTADLLCNEVIEDEEEDILALLDRILKDDDLPDVVPQDQ